MASMRVFLTYDRTGLVCARATKSSTKISVYATGLFDGGRAGSRCGSAVGANSDIGGTFGAVTGSSSCKLANVDKG